LGAVSNLVVRGQSCRDQRREILELELNEKKYPVEKAKGSAREYTET
jgi:hypothetical protein